MLFLEIYFLINLILAFLVFRFGKDSEKLKENYFTSLLYLIISGSIVVIIYILDEFVFKEKTLKLIKYYLFEKQF